MEKQAVNDGQVYHMWEDTRGEPILCQALEDGPTGSEGEARAPSVEERSSRAASHKRRKVRVLTEEVCNQVYTFRGPRSHRPVEVRVPFAWYAQYLERIALAKANRKISTPQYKILLDMIRQ